MKRKMEASELVFKIIAYVFLIIFSVMCIYPFIYAIASSLSSESANSGNLVLWSMIGSSDSLHFGATISAYKYVVTNYKFWVSYANTLFMTVVGTVWCLLYSILGAYALSKKRLLGRHGWNFFLVFTMWFSAGVVATMKNYESTVDVFTAITGTSADSLDLKWLVVLAMGMNATNIILLRNAFEGVPSEIEEAARIDGATEMQVLTKVFIPMSKATIATVTLFFAISRWNGYFWAMKVMTSEATYLSSSQNYSWPVQVFIRDFINEYTSLAGDPDENSLIDWNNSSETANVSRTGVMYAMVVCSIIPIIIIYPFISKYFAKGVNMGGVKE